MGDYEADAPTPSGSEQPNRGPDRERLLAPEQMDAISTETALEAVAGLLDLIPRHLRPRAGELIRTLLSEMRGLDAAIAQIRALAPPDARASGASPQEESKDFPP